MMKNAPPTSSLRVATNDSEEQLHSAASAPACGFFLPPICRTLHIRARSEQREGSAQWLCNRHVTVPSRRTTGLAGHSAALHRGLRIIRSGSVEFANGASRSSRPLMTCAAEDDSPSAFWISALPHMRFRKGGERQDCQHSRPTSIRRLRIRNERPVP